MNAESLISDRLRTLREARGLSQQELATRAELSMSLIAKMEQGKKGDPRLSTLLALATALEIAAGDMVAGLPIMPADAEEVADEPLVEPPRKRKAPRKKARKKHKKKQP